MPPDPGEAAGAVRAGRDAAVLDPGAHARRRGSRGSAVPAVAPGRGPGCSAGPRAARPSLASTATWSAAARTSVSGPAPASAGRRADWSSARPGPVLMLVARPPARLAQPLTATVSSAAAAEPIRPAPRIGAHGRCAHRMRTRVICEAGRGSAPPRPGRQSMRPRTWCLRLRDRNRTRGPRLGPPAASVQLPGVDVVEALDDTGLRQVAPQQLRRRQGLRVELGDLAVPLRVVVVRVDHRFAGQRLDRNVGHRPERHGDHDQVARAARLFRGRRPRLRSELADEVGQALRSAGVLSTTS